MNQVTRIGSKLKTQWLQWTWLCAFEEPTGADTQPMMPRWQPGRLHRKSRLSRQWPADDFACRQHRRMLSPETYRFSQLDEVFAL